MSQAERERRTKRLVAAHEKAKKGRVQTDGLPRPPHNLEAEMAVLGCVLMEPVGGMAECLERLRMGAAAFFDIRHQMLFEAMSKLFAAGRSVNPVTLVEELRNTVGVDKLGDGAVGYVASLPDKAPSAAALGDFLAIVREKYFLRQARAVCAGIAARVTDFEGDIDALMNEIERELFALGQARTMGRDAEWRAMIHLAIEQMEEYHRGGAQMKGLPTGFDYLDKMLCGMEATQMIVLAGRPATGKTSLAFNIVEHIAVRLQIPVGVFSLEMSGAQLGMRSLFQYARADMQRFRTGFMRHEDVPKLTEAATKLASAPIVLDESGDLTITEIRAKARRWVADKKVRLLVIDYLGLVKGTKDYRDRKDEVSEVSNHVKKMAKELNIPIIALAQLNRELEKDRNRVPQLSDLRDSGDIEQDADVVGILYRPKLTKEEQASYDNGTDWAERSERVNLQICKQRNGPTGKVEFLFERACMRFQSYKRAKILEDQNEL